MEVAFDRRVVPSPQALFRELEGEAVILDIATERYLGLNDVGTRMWQSLSEEDSIEAACQVLLEEYDTDEQTLRRDLRELVGKLVDEGLVSLAAPEG